MAGTAAGRLAGAGNVQSFVSGKGRGASVDIVGRQELSRKLHTLSTAIRRQVKDAINRAAVTTQTEAKKRCPVDTGRLRSSIALRWFAGGFAAEVGTNVEYAAYVEFGTRRMGARPFLGPAFEQVRSRLVSELAQALAKAAQEAAS